MERERSGRSKVLKVSLSEDPNREFAPDILLSQAQGEPKNSGSFAAREDYEGHTEPRD